MNTAHNDTGSSRWLQYEAREPEVAAGWALANLVGPNPLYGSNGIRIAPDGTLWITQVNGDQITSWDPVSGKLALADPMGSPMIGPDDIAFDADGAFFVTETLNNRVTGRRGGDYIVVLDETTGPNGITVDPLTNRLYADEMSEGGRVLELFPGERNRVRVIADGLDWLNALECGPDGRLYFPQVFAGSIAAVNVEGGVVETVATDLALPVAVKFDAAGRMVVAQAGIGEITAIDSSGKRRALASPGISIDNFCFNASGDLFTSNFVEARVERWDPRTGLRTAIGTPGGLIGPASVNRWDDTDLLVADHNSIIRVGPDGSLDRVTRLLGNQQFVADGAVRVDGVLIALTLAGEVLSVDPRDGSTAKLVETAGSMTSQILGGGAGGASAIAATLDRVLVGVGSEIIEMRADGSDRVVRSTAVRRVDAIAADPSSRVLAAACTGSGAISIERDGAVSVHEGFMGPEALAIFDGALFVAETAARRLTRVELANGRRDVVVDHLPLGMPRDSVRMGRHSSLFAHRPDTLVIGNDGDGSIRTLRRV